MNAVDSRSLLDVVLRWILALAFAVAAGLKLANLPQDGAAQTMFSALPGFGKVGLVAVELSLACLLVSGHFRKFTAIATALLLCTFLAALMFELTSSDPRPCGCFGTYIVRGPAATRHMLWLTLTMDGVLLASALTLIFRKGARG